MTPDLSPQRRRSGAGRTACAWCAVFMLVVVPARAATRDTDVKAAYLYNFAHFAGWPPSAFETASSPFRFCLFGDDALSAALQRLITDEHVDGHAMVLQSRPPVAELVGCHIVFIGRDTPGASAILAGTRGASALTVGEDDSFLDAGGVVRLVLEGGRVKFDVNPRPAALAGVTLRSGLLQVARRVQP